jgi:hypothetical protein
MAHVQYISGSTASLRLASESGVPSAATIEILHPATGTLGAPVAATLPTAAATVTSDAPARVAPSTGYTVDTTVGLAVRQRVLAISALGEISEVQIAGLEATKIYLHERLPYAMATGSQFADHVVTYDALALENARAYRAVWTLTVDGETVVNVTPFDVVNQPFEVLITKQDIIGRWPDARDRMRADWREMLGPAQDEIFDDMVRRGIEPDQVFSTSMLVSAGAWWCIHKLSMVKSPGGDRADDALRKDFWGYYQRALKILESSHLRVDLDDDGVLGTDDPQSPTSEVFFRGVI